MTVRPCSRSSCQHCGKRAAIFLIDGFGVLRRRHEAMCPLSKAPVRASEEAEVTVPAALPTVPEESIGGSQPSSTSVGDSQSVAETPSGGLLARLPAFTCRKRRRSEKPRDPAPGCGLEGPGGTQPTDGSSGLEASALLRAFCPRPQSSDAADAWLRALADKSLAHLSVQLPPAGGAGWNGPLESKGSNWKMDLWYRWSGSTSISSLSRVTLPGTLCEVVSLFREADKVSNWLPFVSGGDCHWSEDVPALLTGITAKVPIVPRRFSALIHRAFITDFHAPLSSTPGVYIVEWTPAADDTSTGFYCGMPVPSPPPHSTAMQVTLSTTLVYSDPENEGSCVVVMAGENDFKVNQRFVPDMVLRRFLAFNSRAVAANLTDCLQDMDRFGYTERIHKDPQVFYQALRRCARLASAKSEAK
ncbi:unnamed protein product [Effrenium voratum]|nr:unnamed protein product [Effrenium voratum]